MENRWTSMALAVATALLLAGCVTKPASVKGQDESAVVVDAGSATATASADEVKVYQVQKGDELWDIAARKDIYGDATLYPLLYRANSDLLSSPNRVEPGTKLIVPRGQSVTELEAAREEARAAHWRRPGRPAPAPSATPSPIPTAVPTAAPSPVPSPAPTAAAKAPYTPLPFDRLPQAKPGHGLLWALLALLALLAALAIWFLLRRKRSKE